MVWHSGRHSGTDFHIYRAIPFCGGPAPKKRLINVAYCSERKYKSTSAKNLLGTTSKSKMQNTYKCISVAYVVFGYTSSQDDYPCAVGSHCQVVHPWYIWNQMYCVRPTNVTETNWVKTPMKTFYPQLCPISSRDSHMRRNTTCLLWRHLSGQGWTWGCHSKDNRHQIRIQ